MYIYMSDSFVFTCLFGQDKTILTVDNFERVTFGLVDSPDFLEIKSIWTAMFYKNKLYKEGVSLATGHCKRLDMIGWQFACRINVFLL